MSEEEFRRGIVEKHRQYFDHIYMLHQFAEEAARKYRGLSRTAYHASLSLIFAKAYKSFDAVRRLCEIASCEDAAVILRSLLNLLAVTRWISLDPGKRAKKYLAWYWVAMRTDAERFKDRFPAAWIPTIQGHYNRVKREFECKDAKGKIRLAKRWYEPEARTIQDLFVQVGLETQYEEAYRTLSAVEHSDCIAYFAMVAESEKGTDESRLEVHSDLFVPPYLRNAFQYFGDIFSICNRTNPLADATTLKEIITTGIKFYETDMRARGMKPY
jgi:hypothetical protein